ncbi:hypothetical protein IP68_13765 [Blastomonas sp. AAP25]|nr:hypothetical protein IP68_13765 [Blastomonas sp. AAP25]
MRQKIKPAPELFLRTINGEESLFFGAARPICTRIQQSEQSIEFRFAPSNWDSAQQEEIASLQ